MTVIQIEENEFHLGSRKTTNRPSKGPFDIFLQQGVFLLNAIPIRRSYSNIHCRKKKKMIVSLETTRKQQYIPGFFSKNIRMVKYLCRIISLVGRNGFPSSSVSITHNLNQLQL